MKLLGAIIAGGNSSRMGADKATMVVGGKPMIEHIALRLLPLTDDIVISGHSWPDFAVVSDGAYAGQGPLAGLLAALTYAAENGFDAVLTAPCDALPVPDLRPLIGEHAAVVDGHWLFGFWPVSFAQSLADHLAHQPDRSVRGWIVACGARQIAPARNIHNLNTPADIMLYEAALETVA